MFDTVVYVNAFKQRIGICDIVLSKIAENRCKQTVASLP